MKLPEPTKSNIDNYIKFGTFPGDFVASVLKNDLRQAQQRADLACRKALSDIIAYVFDNVPPEARGTDEAINAWCRRKYNEQFKDPRND